MITKERLYVLDLLRFIAFILVVLQHISVTVVSQYSHVPESWWWVSNLYDSISRICVPLFFIITGAVIFNRKFDTMKDIYSFLLSRLKLIVVPLVAWNFIYMYYNKINYAYEMSFFELLKRTVEGTTPFTYHFWYLYAIMAIYLVVPILKVYITSASRLNIGYFLTFWFITSSLIPVANKFEIYLGLPIELVTKYVGYIVIGYVLRELFLNRQLLITTKWYIASIVTFASGVILTMLLTYWLTLRNNNLLDEFFYTYTSFNVIIMSISICIIGMYITQHRKWISHVAVKKCITYFSHKLSYGIYLIHLLIIALFDSGLLGFRVNAFQYNPLFTIPITTLIILISSAFIVYLLKKLPIIKHIVP